MNEVSFLAGEADAGLRGRLEEEISAFNAPGSGTPNAAAREVTRTATTTST